MTKNYIKPELEMISVCSEGVLAASVEGKASGEGVTFGTEFDPWK